MIGWGMKKHFTKSLTVIFAVLGVYFVAFKVLMKVEASVWYDPPRGIRADAQHEPRWGSDDTRERFLEAKAMRTFFAPLVWMDRKVRGRDRWHWDGQSPEPGWVEEWYAELGSKP